MSNRSISKITKSCNYEFDKERFPTIETIKTFLIDTINQIKHELEWN